MKATINDVARLAKVSHTTVSNVLNDTGSVSQKTRERVLQAVKLLNYEQNIVARSLKLQKSKVIGVVISDNSNPLFSHVIKGIEYIATLRGYNVILCNTDQDPIRESAQIKALNERQVDGVIISLAEERTEHLDSFMRNKRPVVFINRMPDRVYGDVILTDNFFGSYSAVSHLLELGHRKIGIVGCSPKYVTGRERLDGYLTALQEYGLQPEDSFIIKATIRNGSEGCGAAMSLLENEEKPTAVLGATYYSTLGILKAASRLELEIPTDISVVGFDDPDWSECYNPPLTAISQPGIKMGKTAAEVLIDRIEKKREGQFQTIRIKPTLNRRKSALSI